MKRLDLASSNSMLEVIEANNGNNHSRARRYAHLIWKEVAFEITEREKGSMLCLQEKRRGRWYYARTLTELRDVVR